MKPAEIGTVAEVENSMEVAANPPTSRPLSVTARAGRSAVTNGKRLHVVRPGDTAWARRFRDVLAEILSDLGRDGLSEGQRQLARRAATISIACEKMEGEAAAGAEIDLELYGRLVDRLGRAFHRLGLKRQPKPVETLHEYLTRKYPDGGRGEDGAADIVEEATP
jgi:hypothetical protein